MIYIGYDLPLSLHTCDKLASGWDATGCTGGVFMENYQSSYGVISHWLKEGPDLPVRLGRREYSSTATTWSRPGSCRR